MTYYTVSGGVLRTQAIPVTGSAITGYTGDWCIETQYLNIRYARVPDFIYGTPYIPFDLSGSYSQTEAVLNTRLLVVINAHHSIRKEIGTTYSTSSDLQPQRFTIYPMQTDKFGNSYGTVSGTLLGPAGTVMTTQNYIKRDPWDSTIHTETTSSIQGSNFCAYLLNNDGGIDTTLASIAHLGLEGPDFNTARNHTIQTNYCGSRGTLYLVQNSLYSLIGQYDVSLESSAMLVNFLTTVGSLVSTGGLFKNKLTEYTDFFGGYFYVIPLPSSKIGIPAYNPNRHDYT